MIVHATENQLEDVAALALKLFTQTGGDTIHKEMRAILSDGNAAILWKEREAARLAIWKESLWKNPAVTRRCERTAQAGRGLGKGKGLFGICQRLRAGEHGKLILSPKRWFSGSKPHHLFSEAAVLPGRGIRLKAPRPVFISQRSGHKA